MTVEMISCCCTNVQMSIIVIDNQSCSLKHTHTHANRSVGKHCTLMDVIHKWMQLTRAELADAGDLYWKYIGSPSDQLSLVSQGVDTLLHEAPDASSVSKEVTVCLYQWIISNRIDWVYLILCSTLQSGWGFNTYLWFPVTGCSCVYIRHNVTRGICIAY